MVAPSEIEAVVREERARIVAHLARRTGDLSLAEDAVQAAFESALVAWRDAIPARPGAWITQAARNAALDALRHRSLVEAKHAELARALEEIDVEHELPDERLRLLFVCCHPAIAEADRLALALSTLCGLSVAAIARLFFCAEPAMAQRLVRAKRKIALSRVPFSLPEGDALDARLASVLTVVYLFFTEGYASADEDAVLRPEIAAEAIRLGRLVCQLCPGHAEARGLYALMLLHHARSPSRTDERGAPVPLDEQDRRRWDAATIAEGVRHLEDALARGRPGPYQVQAAIAALHATAPSVEATDWLQIAGLYRTLLEVAPSPSAALALALAEGMASTPARGLEVLGELERLGLCAGSHRVAATRAELLRRAGDPGARAAYDEAIALTASARERGFLERRRASLPGAA